MIGSKWIFSPFISSAVFQAHTLMWWYSRKRASGRQTWKKNDTEKICMFVESLRNSKNHFRVFRESKADHEKWLLTSPNQIFMGECRETCLISFHDMRKVDDIGKKKNKRAQGEERKKKGGTFGGVLHKFFPEANNLQQLYLKHIRPISNDIHHKAARIDHNQSRHTQCRCHC